VLRKILGSNRAKVMGGRKNSVTRSFVIYYSLPHIQNNEDELGGACGWHMCGRKEMCSPGFWWQNLKEIIT
jgi:hypothetical protein